MKAPTTSLLPGLAFLADRPDLAVTAPAANGLVQLFGLGNGTFVASTPTPAGNAPHDLALGDGTGGFADVVEPHGVQVASPHDYFRDPSSGNVTEPRLNDRARC